MSILNKHPKYLGDLAFIICILIYLSHSLYFADYICDDAGISYTYAKNLAEGYGFVLNPGDEHIEGYSNFLWVVILSIFIRLGIFDPVMIPKILAIILSICSLFILYKLPKIAFDSKGSALDNISVILLAASTPYVMWGISGLENSLFIFLLISAIYLYINEMKKVDLFPFSSIIFVCIALTRPEGIMYFVVAAIHKLIYIKFERNVNRMDVLWFIGFLLPYSIYFIWHYQYFSYFVPNTYYAKVPEINLPNRLLNYNSSGWLYVRNFFIDYRMFLLVLSIPSLLIAKRLWVNSILFSIVLATIFYPIYAGGDWMIQYRFLTPFLPFGYLFIQEGIKETINIFLRFSGREMFVKSIILYIFIIIVLILLISPSIAFSREAREYPTIPFKDVAIEGKYFKSLAEEAFISDTASLMVPDLGGNSFYSGLMVIDYAGLADIAIAHHKWNKVFFEDYVFNETKPTFIRTHSTWTARTQIDKCPQLWTDYTPIRIGYWKTDLHGPEYLESGILYGEFVRKDVFVLHNATYVNLANHNFNDEIDLLGYNISKNLTKRAGKIHYTFFWKCTKDISNDYNFVINISKGKNVIYRRNYTPIYGWYPTTRWLAGEILKEEVDIILPKNISDGVFNISIGIFNSSISETIAQNADLGSIEVNDVKTALTAQLHYDKYLSYYKGDKFEEALGEIKEALKYLPENISYKKGLNDTYIELSNQYYMEAERYIKKNRINNGTHYLLKVNQLKKVPDNTHLEFKNMSNYYYDTATMLENEDKMLDAFKYYKLALKLNPGNCWARHRLEGMRIYVLLNKSKCAINSHIPEIKRKMDVNIDNKLVFLGYNISNTKLRSGDNFGITYYWKCLQPMGKNYFIFVHIINETSLAVGLDHAPLYGLYPTTKWKPGEIIVEHYDYILPTSIQAGMYQFRLGIWYPPEGYNLKVINRNLSDNSGSIMAGYIEVINSNKEDRKPNQSIEPALTIISNKTNQMINMPKSINDLIKIQLFDGDALTFQDKPQVIAHANTTYSKLPRGVTLKNSSGPFWFSADGQVIALVEKDQWIEANYTGEDIDTLGVQFVGDDNDGWASVLIDGMQAWEGNTYGIYKYLQISGLFPGHHSIRVQEMGIKGTNNMGNGTHVTVAFFGFGPTSPS